METTLRYRVEGKVPVVGLGADGGWITLGEFETIKEAKQSQITYKHFWDFKLVIIWEENEMTTIEGWK